MASGYELYSKLQLLDTDSSTYRSPHTFTLKKSLWIFSKLKLYIVLYFTLLYKLYIVLYYTNMPCYSCVFTDAKGEVMTSSTTVALVSSEITNKDEEGVNKLKYNTF